MVITTLERVRLARQENPTRTVTHIARDIGVSRECVRQILVRLHLPTWFPRVYPLNCSSCGSKLGYQNTSGLCQPCAYLHRRKYDYEAINQMYKPCPTCGRRSRISEIAKKCGVRWDYARRIIKQMAREGR